MNQNRNFKKFMLLWTGELLSAIGGGLTSFGVGVYVFQQTGSAAAMALVTLTSFLPSLLLSAPAGILADRYDRRLLMMIETVLRTRTYLYSDLYVSGRCGTLADSGGNGGKLYIFFVTGTLLQGNHYRPAVPGGICKGKRPGRTCGFFQISAFSGTCRIFIGNRRCKAAVDFGYIDLFCNSYCHMGRTERTSK